VHGKRLSAYTARQALNEHRYRVDSAPMVFVTAKAYKAAGGTLVQDLFADRESSQTVADPELLERLAMERLEEVAAPLRAEGWKWVSVTLKTADGRSSMQRAVLEVVPPSPELAEQLAAAREVLRVAQLRQDKLEDADDLDGEGAGEGGDESDDGQSAWEAVCAAVEKAEAVVEHLEQGMSMFPEDVRALAGCFVYLNHAGVLQVDRGYLQAGDVKAYKALSADRARRAAGEGGEAGEGGAPAPAPAGSAEATAEAAEGLAMSMIHSLSAHRTMALQALVAQNARLGLELVAASLAGPLLREARGVERGVPGVCLKPVFCTAELTQMEAMERNPGTAVVDGATTRWKTAFATWLAEHQDAEESSAGPVHGFVAGLSNEDLHALLAVSVARCIDLRTQSPSNQSALGLCDLTNLDMRAFFDAQHHPYLARSSKASVLADAKAAGVIVPDTWPKLKKGELLDVAGEELASRRFVPAYLDYKPARG
jgi:ParB family transcriptional regulator, chromosome partitioning protein